MEIPTWLNGWWNYWADFTGLLWWPAWAAVFTGAALWNTARLADRGARDSRRKEAVFVMAVRELLSDFLSEVENFDERVQSLRTEARSAIPATVNEIKIIDRAKKIVEDTWKDDKIIEQIESIKLIDFPTVDSFIIFSTAKIDIYLIKESLEEYDGSSTRSCELKSECENLNGRLEELKSCAYKLAPFHLREGDEGLLRRIAPMFPILGERPAHRD